MEAIADEGMYLGIGDSVVQSPRLGAAETLCHDALGSATTTSHFGPGPGSRGARRERLLRAAGGAIGRGARLEEPLSSRWAEAAFRRSMVLITEPGESKYADHEQQ